MFGRRAIPLHLLGFPLSCHRRVVDTKSTTSNTFYFLFNYMLYIIICKDLKLTYNLILRGKYFFALIFNYRGRYFLNFLIKAANKYKRTPSELRENEKITLVKPCKFLYIISLFFNRTERVFIIEAREILKLNKERTKRKLKIEAQRKPLFLSSEQARNRRFFMLKRS